MTGLPAASQSLRQAAGLAGAGRWAEAEAGIVRALALEPGDPQALKLLALVRMKLGHVPAVELEGGGAGPAVAVPAAPAGAVAATLTGFAVERLLDGSLSAQNAILRLSIEEGAHVRRSALLAAAGAQLTPATGRRQGRPTGARLAPGVDLFFRCVAAGDVWLASAPAGGLAVLTLEDDIFYIRQDLVAAFGHDLVWETGAAPFSDLQFFQFRSSGQVVIDMAIDDVVAVRVTGGPKTLVDRARMLGWVGRIVVSGDTDSSRDSGLLECDGEGVVLLSKRLAR